MSNRCSNPIHVALRCDRSAPGCARAAIRTIDGIDRVQDDAQLIASELVTNAVLHAGCDCDEEIELVAQRVPAGIRIEVADVGRRGAVPAIAPDDYQGRGGMGLRLVHALAMRWGVERTERLRVWAELAV